MKICAFMIENSAVDLLLTEVRFYIASARASLVECVCFETDRQGDEKRKLLTLVSKNLQSMKKEGRIDFFATGEDFEAENAKASYLINKLPRAAEIISNEKTLCIVKL